MSPIEKLKDEIIAQLRADKSALEGDNASLKADNESLKVDNESLKDLNAEQEVKNAILQDIVDEQSVQIDNLNNRVHNMAAHIILKHTQVNNLKIQCAIFQNIIDGDNMSVSSDSGSTDLSNTQDENNDMSSVPDNGDVGSISPADIREDEDEDEDAMDLN
ncbi:hypothetical protein IL306_006130 [Fusarium sp. DS 682]|nr:hypothetical protein IL306_006130 [Fusarium sp. DS 682]